MSENIKEEKLLEVKNLITSFKTEKGKIRAVNDVSFGVKKGKTLGIVGESGSGKSVTALSIMKLIMSPPGMIESGEILFHGDNILKYSDEQMRRIRGNRISMIFQEPMTSLNPVYTVGNQIAEVIALHQGIKGKSLRERGVEILQQVGISAPEKRYDEYPHQLSGGMRQRVMIAIALACGPEVLIADEPTTALDVTIQAQILELLQKLQDDVGMSIILITHDLGVVAEVCHDVAVMYCGRIIEKSPVQSLFDAPRHPYTKGLIRSIPSCKQREKVGESSKKSRLPTIEGVVPSLASLPSGCSFQDRCFKVERDCCGDKGVPFLEKIKEEMQHEVSCFHPV